MITFIDKYRDRFGVEFICRSLAENREGGFITSRGYRAFKRRMPSARALRDQELIPVLKQVHKENYSVYGARKLVKAMQQANYRVGRDQVARLMRAAGLRGSNRGRSPVTTRPAKTADVRPDLVNRCFKAAGPNRLWVADITYVRTVSGFVYTAFVTDVYSRKIVGWATKRRLTTEALPLEALDQAITTARGSLGELVHHSDHGSQYVSIAYHERLVREGIGASTGSVGDSYDNALAESVNGLYKSELINLRKWQGVEDVEWETLCWVHWWNSKRLHSSLGYSTPQEVEDRYWEAQEAEIAGRLVVTA